MINFTKIIHFLENHLRHDLGLSVFYLTNQGTVQKGCQYDSLLHLNRASQMGESCHPSPKGVSPVTDKILLSIFRPFIKLVLITEEPETL